MDRLDKFHFTHGTPNPDKMTPAAKGAITTVKHLARLLRAAVAEAQAEGITIEIEPFFPRPTNKEATMIDILTEPPLTFRFFLRPSTHNPEQNQSPQRP